MNASMHRGKASRSRATQRLRNLTIGTTLAGLAASAGFGVLAAATFDGTAVTTADAADSSTTNPDSGLGSSTGTSQTTDSAAGLPSSVGSSSSSSSGLSSTTGVTKTSRRAHVTTGGS